MNFKLFVAFAASGVLLSLALVLTQVNRGQTIPGARWAAAPVPLQPDTLATLAYRGTNARMHRDMNIQYANDADIDFVRGMIPHHQGSIDMSKVLLQHGKDEQTRQWAMHIIREQEREIAEMRAWLKMKGVE